MKALLRSLANESLSRRALSLATPVVLAYFCIALVLGAELWMVGELGTKDVAAVGLGSSLFLILLIGFHALELACQTIVARRYGEKRWRQIGAVLDNSLLLAGSIGLVLSVVLWFLGPHFLHTPDAEVHRKAVEYFKIRLVSLTPLICSLTLIGFYNGIGRPQINLLGFASSGLVNLILLRGLVIGAWGMPALGTRGAAYASTISVFLGFTIMMAPLFFRTLRVRFNLFKLRHFSMEAMKRIGAVALPVFLQGVFYHLAFFLFLKINAEISTVALAASTIVFTVNNFSYLPALGFGIIAATLISQSLGARNARRGTMSVLSCLALGMLLMGGIGLLFVAFSKQIMEFYLRFPGAAVASAEETTLHNSVVHAGGMILTMVGALQVFDAVALILQKALQGAGLTRFVMYAGIFLQYLVLLPLAWVLGIAMQKGIVGAWTGYCIFIVTNGLVMLFKFRTGDWRHVRL